MESWVNLQNFHIGRKRGKGNYGEKSEVAIISKGLNIVPYHTSATEKSRLIGTKSMITLTIYCWMFLLKFPWVKILSIQDVLQLYLFFRMSSVFNIYISIYTNKICI